MRNQNYQHVLHTWLLARKRGGEGDHTRLIDVEKHYWFIFLPFVFPLGKSNFGTSFGTPAARHCRSPPCVGMLSVIRRILFPGGRCSIEVYLSTTGKTTVVEKYFVSSLEMVILDHDHHPAAHSVYLPAGLRHGLRGVSEDEKNVRDSKSQK